MFHECVTFKLCFAMHSAHESHQNATEFFTIGKFIVQNNVKSFTLFSPSHASHCEGRSNLHVYELDCFVPRSDGRMN